VTVRSTILDLRYAMARRRTQDVVAHETSPARVLIVSNRLPISVSMQGSAPTFRASIGGLATGLREVHARGKSLWIGWPGEIDQDDSNVVALRNGFASRRIVPITLSQPEVRGFYDEVSNAVLWPVFHDRLDRLPLQPTNWDVYECVNARFADVVAAQYRPGDVIWVHDYQLLRLPALLRDRLPEARIGFFLHIPFPEPGIFEALPQRDALLSGLLGADLIGFHTVEYVRNFANTVRHTLGLEVASYGEIEHEGRTVRVGAFPMGVDAQAFTALAQTAEVQLAAKVLRAGAPRLIAGVDRLDYSKGVPRRLLAFEQMLLRHPEWRGRVQLLQIAVPSRERVGAYRRFRRDVEELIGRINGRYSTPSWTPINYMYASVSRETLVAIYLAADVMLVTPVRDGMNLVAKEFVASRTDDDGVLVLSEFAGASAELDEAMIVNPYDVTEVAETIHLALSMTDEERRGRMQALRRKVLHLNVHWWTDQFLTALGE
jgi:trehalose 6-phosphate synthase/phosphatase